MVPAFAADRAPWTPRLGFVYIGNGIVHKTFKLPGTGTAFAFSPVLRPLEPLRQYLTVVSGLDHAQANNFGDGTGDHPRSSAAWLTGVHAYDRTRPGVEVKLATTADQLAADVLGPRRPCARSSSPSTPRRRARATRATASTSTRFPGATRRRRT